MLTFNITAKNSTYTVASVMIHEEDFAFIRIR